MKRPVPELGLAIGVDVREVLVERGRELSRDRSLPVSQAYSSLPGESFEMTGSGRSGMSRDRNSAGCKFSPLLGLAWVGVRENTSASAEVLRFSCGEEVSRCLSDELEGPQVAMARAIPFVEAFEILAAASLL